jgi:hypothetical protein
MGDLIEATLNWMDDEHAVDFVTFLDNYRATMMAKDVAPEQPQDFEEEIEIEFDDQMTEAEFWSYVNG